jgi:hypothetical protein
MPFIALYAGLPMGSQSCSLQPMTLVTVDLEALSSHWSATDNGVKQVVFL